MQITNKIQILKGDITKVEVDAIVNAANTSLLGGGGVDGAIHRAGGKSILEDCKKIIAKQGDCKTGEAVITTAGNLKAKFVIHTVGPVWNGGGKNEAFYLASCYSKSLQIAVDNNCKSIAFPFISTGVYGYPINEAAKIAVQEVAYFLSQNNTIEKIIFVCYDDENFDCVKQYAAEYLPKQAKANNTLTNEEVVAIHLGWELDGYTIEDIISAEEKLSVDDPFTIINLRDIQNFLGGTNFVLPERVNESDYEKISFIYYKDCGFDGNIDFLCKCVNIETIKIGCACIGNIVDLKPLAKLKKLKSIDFHRHKISDLSPLSEIESLDELILWGNPVSTIKPIVHLKNLKTISLSDCEDSEVFELLKNSPHASVKFHSLQNTDIEYNSFWINGWAFKTSYHRVYPEKENLIAIEAMNPERFKIHLEENPAINYKSLMKEKLGEIAIYLLSKGIETIYEVEYYNEDFKYICGVFKYQ